MERLRPSREFGIEKIVKECKKIVEKNNNANWVQVDDLLGMSFNHEKAYWTFRDEFHRKGVAGSQKSI